MAGSRFPYTLREDKAILRYIMDGSYEAVVKGNYMWVKMAEDNILPGRSWQSLKNRFKRNIIPDYSRPEFGLTQEEKVRLKIHLPISVTNESARPTKRHIDPRLIADKMRKRISLDDNNQNTCNTEKPKNEILENISRNQQEKRPSKNFLKKEKTDTTRIKTKSSSTDLLEDGVSGVAGPSKIANENEKILSPEYKEFYSLDMEWSDEDLE